MVVDTGAFTTSISSKDARTIGLDFSTLERDNDAFGIGGTLESYFLKGISLAFRDTKSSFHVENLPTINALKGTPDMVPSLLGLDVLKNYKVYFDSKGVIIEK
jgi:predicted aspartyl protease